MKTTWNYKLLQFLTNKKGDGGFTLIELLVVIIIIGILSAIALPAFLNQANRAKQTEAQNYVGSANRAQQAYRLENTTFSDRLANLELGIAADSENYRYTDQRNTDPGVADSTAGNLAANGGTSAGIFAQPKDIVLFGFTGVAYTVRDTTGNINSSAVLCKSLTPGFAATVAQPAANATSIDAAICSTTDGN